MNTSADFNIFTAGLHRELAGLYQRIDRRSKALFRTHGRRLHCGLGCTSCCIDGLSVFEIEALNIQYHYADLLKNEQPHPEGACAFLDETGACRIYDQRPYVCRTQGLPLRWLEEGPQGGLVEMRDICPLNEEGQPVEELPAEACWEIGPVEEALAALQQRLTNGTMRRMLLRSLFVKS